MTAGLLYGMPFVKIYFANVHTLVITVLTHTKLIPLCCVEKFTPERRLFVMALQVDHMRYTDALYPFQSEVKIQIRMSPINCVA